MALGQPTEFKRGDIYWVAANSAVGSEEGIGRPALIISNDMGCKTSPVVTIVWVSTKWNRNSSEVDLGYATKRRSWAKCNQIYTVDKSRFGDYIGRPTAEVLDRVDDAICMCLGIPYEGNNDELKDEIESQQNLIDEMQSEIFKLKMELAVANKMYDVALNKIVELRTKEFEVPVEPKVVVEPVLEEPKKQIDLNTCEPTELLALGVSAVVASRLIESRPYRNIEEICRIEGVTNMTYSFLKSMVVLSPVKQVKPVETSTIPRYTWEEFKMLPIETRVKYVTMLREKFDATNGQIATIVGTKASTWSVYICDHPELKDPVKARKKTPENTAKVEEFLNGSKMV